MMSKNVRTIRWSNYFKKSGLHPDLRKAYLVYVKKMLKTDLPVIFEFHHLAQLLGRTPAYLGSAVNASDYHYRDFNIPKRAGGSRTISAPYPALLSCQQWIKDNILNKCGIHTAAHGFVDNRSIKSNALIHLNHKHLLKMDLKDFFPSIPVIRVISVFRRLGYPANVSFYLASLCCYQGCLPQGAATSPILSNIIAYSLDVRLSTLAHKYDLKYSRYADDITFSGKHIGIGFSKTVKNISITEGFIVNDNKTKLCRSNGRRIVTGISVAGGELRVPKPYKRKLRQEVHYIRLHGFQSHMNKLRVRKPFYLYSLIGKMVFWQWIEPHNKYCIEALAFLRGLQEKESG